MASLRTKRERHIREQRASVQPLAEHTRYISSAAASRSRSRAAADDEADTSCSTSGSSYAPSTADGAPEPGGAAGTGPHAGGASHLVPCGAAGPLDTLTLHHIPYIYDIKGGNLGYTTCCLSASDLCYAL